MRALHRFLAGWFHWLLASILAIDSSRGGEGCIRATLLANTRSTPLVSVCAPVALSSQYVYILARVEYAYYALVLNTVLRSMSVMKYAYYERTLE